MSRWFPGGHRSVRIGCLPGTTYRLSNRYRLYVSNNNLTAHFNAAIHNMYGLSWYGNIVVVKLGKVMYERVIHVSREEGILTDIIIGM
jgi:hypothetical protein